MPLNILQCMGQTPLQSVMWPKMSVVPTGLRSPVLNQMDHVSIPAIADFISSSLDNSQFTLAYITRLGTH